MTKPEEEPKWGLTEAGARLVLFALRYYTLVLIASCSTAFVAGFAIGWWVRSVVP